MQGSWNWNHTVNPIQYFTTYSVGFFSLEELRVHKTCDLHVYAVEYTEKNSKTFKDPVTQIQGVSRTKPVFKDLRGIEFRDKKFQNFKGCMGTPC